MKNFRAPLGKLSLAVSASCALGLGNVAFSQEQVDISGPDFEELPSPDIDGTTSKSFDQKDWLEVEAGLTVPAMNREMEETGFLDRMVVKWYLAIEDDATDRTVLLTKDINHINVPVDEEVFTSVYLSPNTLKRLTGSDSAGQGAVEVAGLEVLVNGVKVGEATSSMDPGWWQAPSLSRGDQFPLRNKNETPFKIFWWDRYAEIEEER